MHYYPKAMDATLQQSCKCADGSADSCVKSLLAPSAGNLLRTSPEVQLRNMHWRDWSTPCKAESGDIILKFPPQTGNVNVKSTLKIFRSFYCGTWTFSINGCLIQFIKNFLGAVQMNQKIEQLQTLAGTFIRKPTTGSHQNVLILLLKMN